MSTLSKSLKSEINVIIPKTRSEWITRSNNTTYESSLSDISNLIHSGIIYQGTHSKSGIIHTISGIPDINFDLLAIKFKATSDYTEGDTFSINGVSYTVSIGSILFKIDSIVECDIDKVNHIVYIKNKESSYNPTDIPQFTYSGNYEVVDDGELGWRIKFTSSGSFTLISPTSINIDCFVVGGGGSGGGGGYRNSDSGGDSGGGAGGYTKSYFKVDIDNSPFDIVIGSGGTAVGINKNGNSGGQTSINALNVLVDGGSGGISFPNHISGAMGGSGGSGGGGQNGAGGSDGSNGQYTGGKGQGTTTREFGDPTGTLYSGGGGGASNAVGGAGGGGKGGSAFAASGYPATFYGGGGGGGGAHYSSGAGFQGIVIIRNAR